ncbi:hypothetical protein ASPBRDRAFT_133507 [Aspergillus brasiliensis CBS 101740]|uniref:NAD(P)-binding domain-containing protein n=1 Tax=Aspergillus brasiliensis (strain CBS 101740 / IMI 381727 / IBT 21946) TaxID=767769 RepID=A0A1L9U9R0_ASPBC|nr:hypothetical protein ASPBRDRAFT_133507 [Aspergillus brasiliensis CBS 101740]
MKIILTGTTGFIGHEILTQCLHNPHITSIVALSRRPLPATVTNIPNLTVKLVDDFLTYPESLLNELRGTEACIWAIGVNRTKDTETARKVNIEYTMAAMEAFGTYLSSSSSVEGGEGKKKFRFVYLSGGMSERDQSRSLWMAGEMRKIRGQVENELTAYEKTNHTNVEVYIARPGMVLARGMSLRTLVFGMGPSIWVDDLAKVLVDVAVNGNEDEDGEMVLENERMLRWKQ